MTMLHHLSLAHYFPILQTLICMVVFSMYVYVNTSLIYGPPLWVKVFIVIILPSVHNNVKCLHQSKAFIYIELCEGVNIKIFDIESISTFIECAILFEKPSCGRVLKGQHNKIVFL